MTIDQTTIAALDLRPALELRAEAERLTARLRAGDPSAIDEAKALLDREADLIDAFRDALRAPPPHEETFELDDLALAVVNRIATGRLDEALDDLTGESEAACRRYLSSIVDVAEAQGRVDQLGEVVPLAELAEILGRPEGGVAS